MNFSLSVPWPNWLQRTLFRRETEELRRRAAITGTARLTKTRSWLGGLIEIETVTEGTLDDPRKKTTAQGDR